MHFNAEIPTHAKNEVIWRRVLVFQLIYSLAGLFLGLASIVGGIVLFSHGVLGSTNWTANVLGASSDISDAAPGSVLFIVGLFIALVTRFKIRLKDTGDSRELKTYQPVPEVLDADDFGHQTFSRKELLALKLALRLHQRVKVLANAQTNGIDKSFRGCIKLSAVV